MYDFLAVMRPEDETWYSGTADGGGEDEDEDEDEDDVDFAEVGGGGGGDAFFGGAFLGGGAGGGEALFAGGGRGGGDEDFFFVPFFSATTSDDDDDDLSASLPSIAKSATTGRTAVFFDCARLEEEDDARTEDGSVGFGAADARAALLALEEEDEEPPSVEVEVEVEGAGAREGGGRLVGADDAETGAGADEPSIVRLRAGGLSAPGLLRTVVCYETTRTAIEQQEDQGHWRHRDDENP